jgi:hypothetical protein
MNRIASFLIAKFDITEDQSMKCGTTKAAKKAAPKKKKAK